MLENEKLANEVDDEELDEVAGGGTYSKDGFLKTTAFYKCDHFTCKRCGRVGKHEHSGQGSCVESFVFQHCRDCTWHSTLRCNNPVNKR